MADGSMNMRITRSLSRFPRLMAVGGVDRGLSASIKACSWQHRHPCPAAAGGDIHGCILLLISAPCTTTNPPTPGSCAMPKEKDGGDPTLAVTRDDVVPDNMVVGKGNDQDAACAHNRRDL